MRTLSDHQRDVFVAVEASAVKRAALDVAERMTDPAVVAWGARPTVKAASMLTGSIGNPSKMPGRAYGLPASQCKTGRKLALIAESVCSGCYAYGRGRYGAWSVILGQWRRLHALREALATDAGTERWIGAMVHQLGRLTGDDRWFRWHDSGDLQSFDHLLAIVAVANRLPEHRFWLPTKEAGLLFQLIREGVTVPPNLRIRLSAPMCGGRMGEIVARKLADAGIGTSTVNTGEGHGCPAPKQAGRCDDCRACWDPTVPNVDYHDH